ncbi:MAG: UDP-3-O-(3-hydroxymyristoyl)glucosamine N-acyltransferase [Pirellula sp.]
MTAIDLPTLAKRVHGELFSRNQEHVITGAAPLADALPGYITLVDHEKHLPRLQESRASACVTGRSFPNIEISQIVVSNPHEAFTKICELFRPQVVVAKKYGLDPLASVADSARVSHKATVEAFSSVADDCIVGEGTHIHRGVTVMHGCHIGKDCQLYPGVVLYPGTVLEDRVCLHAGCVLGSHGFGYRMENGCHVPTAQLGWVHIESDVEIGANTTVDRGTYGATRVGQGTKIDNLVMIAHNCNIGKHNLICSQVGIAGSSSTGEYVVLAGQVGVRDHVHIGDRTMVGAQAGVAADADADKVLLGSPAIPRTEQAILFAAVNRLPELRKTVKSLVKQVEDLQNHKSIGT